MPRDPDVLPSTERFISYYEDVGFLDAHNLKPVYAFDTDRTLGGRPLQMSSSLFWEDQQLDVKKEKASGLQQLAVLGRNRRHVGSAFFISQPFNWEPELMSLFRWIGVPDHTGPDDYYMLFASTELVFEDLADGEDLIFTKEVIATRTQHLVTGTRQYKLLARPRHPKYPDVYTESRSPELAQAAGSMFRPMPEDKKSKMEREPDFVIGVLRCHPSWIYTDKPTEGQYRYGPSGTPAQAVEPRQEDMHLVYGVGQGVSCQVAFQSDVNAAWDECRQLLFPNNLSLSVGDVIAVGQSQIKHRCSTGHGMSGGVVWPLDRPNTFIGIHYGSSGIDSRANYNRAYSADADLFVLNYARFVLPVICKARKEDWPQTYMVEDITKYLLRHRDLLQRNALWGNAEAFFKAQGLNVPGIQQEAATGSN